MASLMNRRQWLKTGALAAAGEMSKASVDVYLDKAKDGAKLYASRHRSLGMVDGLELTDADIEFGDTVPAAGGGWTKTSITVTACPWLDSVRAR